MCHFQLKSSKLTIVLHESFLLILTLKGPTPQKGQTHSNDSSAAANELFECVWPFCGVGA